MNWYPWVLQCSKCENEIHPLEVYANSSGELLLEGYCSICEADVVGEPVHVFTLMEMCEQQDKEDT